MPVFVNFLIAISTSPGAEVNVSLEAPSSNFFFNLWGTSITVCGVYTYLIGNSNINPEIPFCTMCDGPQSDDDRVYGKRCMDGQSLYLGMVGNALHLKFVPVKEVQQVQHQTVGVNTTMIWNINDQRTCAAASAEETNFACVSKHSSCVDTTHMPTGYSCSCDTGYTGNPYVLGGCSRDPGYNPWARQNAQCSRSCGNIEVPFPFGLEEGCSAMTRFQLYCNASKLHLGSEFESEQCIKNINTSEGFLDTEYTSHVQYQMSSYSPFYIATDRQSRRVEWVIANLTCQEAPQHTSTYACVSPDSECIHVNSTVMGYRCKCNEGYVGNPYVIGPDGCQGTPAPHPWLYV
ncbi:uncharacterized protein LOC123409427 [Hordeum vulgare subsp. vulgare]|uniref:uncharacterized protein LOC123409427 n=1 Tax=Hordeum vulgare subsp. vulgare TaxID=112509 RepID=UPI001D1A3675|nr:uncharacterized protein LOC123409427 [Hordeum vulgare subsp. vulgare]